jgi:predicted nucleotidyltransferase
MTTTDMARKVDDELTRIEAAEDIRILYAVESGSRAWGFASPDSDYDVRFIYLRPFNHYLRLDTTRDFLECQTGGELDISGWDLQKALRLLHSSNPTFFEWCNSPLVYRRKSAWERVASLVNSYFLCKPALYHYLNMAKSNYRNYLTGSDVRIKKYFYAIRPLLACRWILANRTPPPMPFDDLVDAELVQDLKPVIARLLSLKSGTSELGQSKPWPELNAYIVDSLEELGETIDALPAVEKPPWDPLNELFAEMARLD